jgi:pimeloyl-ACP methyl ester carboxylesterase
MSIMSRETSMLKLNGLELEVQRRGSGSPLLILTNEEELELDSSLLDRLADKHELIIPSAPGFGHSERPEWISNPDDIAYIYMDLLDHLGIRTISVIGFSLGGWIALEMATKSHTLFSKILLVDPYGVKTGGVTDRDFQDIWTLHPNKVAALKWHDQSKGKRDYASMSDDQLSIVARNIESFARFCWEPYLHNPKLRKRLNRIHAPTLIVWGENDGIATPAYGKSLAALIKGSKFETIASAGHFPHLEQPDHFLALANSFIG